MAEFDFKAHGWTSPRDEDPEGTYFPNNTLVEQLTLELADAELRLTNLRKHYTPDATRDAVDGYLMDIQCRSITEYTEALRTRLNLAIEREMDNLAPAGREG